MTYDELVRSWSDTAHDRLPGDDQDRIVLDCARQLTDDPAGESAYRWVFGLALMLPHTELAGGDVPEVVADAVRAVRRERAGQVCAHREHPGEEEDGEDLLYLFPDVLLMLADPDGTWVDNYTQEQWLCPVTVDRFAAMVLQTLEPGAAPDAPPLLPFAAQRELDSLTAIVEGYPAPGTDVAEEVRAVGQGLRWQRGADLAGQVITAAALTWWEGTALSSDAAYEALVQGFEAVLDATADVECAHDAHPALPRWATAAVCLGIHLSSPGGRGVYERRGACLKEPLPLEPLLCPVFTSSVARDSLDRLRALRAEPVQGEQD